MWQRRVNTHKSKTKWDNSLKDKRYQSTGICVVAPLSLPAPAVSRAHDFRTGNEEENAHAFI